MTWAPFLVGFIFGFATTGCVAVLIFTRKPAAQTLEPWTEEYHEPKNTETKTTVNRRRNIEL